MTLESQLEAAFQAVGADIKALQEAQGGSGGQVMPVGGITWMHPEFVPDEFTDNAHRFVRTGTAVAFEPGGKHDAALAAGFGLYDSVKRVGYADAINTTNIICVDGVSGTLVSLKNKVLFTPWFNSSGVGVIEFPQHPEVPSNTNSYCWSPVLQTWLVGFVKPTAEGARELCVDRLSGGKWVETYRSNSGTPVNSEYYSYSFACSSQDTAIFEFTLNNVRYELAIALDTNGVVIGKVLKTESSIKYDYRRWFAGKDGYVLASSTTANPTVSDFTRTAAETVRQDAVTYKTTIQLTLLLGAGNASNMRVVYHEGVWVLLYGKTNPSRKHTVVASTTGVMGFFDERINLTSTNADISSLAFTEGGWVGNNSDSSSTSNKYITSPTGMTWTTKSSAGSVNSRLLNPLFKDKFIASDGVYPYSSGNGVARTPTSFDFNGMAANDYGRVFAFSNGVIGFIPHDRQYHLMDLVYTYNTATSNTTLCKTVNGQFFVYMTGVGLLHSVTGMTWTVLATGLTGDIYDVEYLSGTYVVAGGASGNKNFAYSTDSLASWTTGYIRTTSTNVFRLLNTGERLVALCSTGASYSETGTVWSNSSGVNFNSTQRAGLVHDGVIDVFVYSSQTAVVQWQSVNGGATFTNVKTVTLPYPSTSGPFLDMCIRKGKWWALRGGFVYSSTDGNTWSPEPLMDTPISNPYPQLIEVGGELRFMTGHDSWVVLDSDSNVPALVGTKLEVVQESGAVGFIRIE